MSGFRTLLRKARPALFASTLALSALSAAEAQDATPLTVFIGAAPLYDSIWMGDAEGFFKEEGLAPDFRLFPSGTTALQTFITGQGDLVTNGELPGVNHWVKANKDYRLISVIERDSVNYVAAVRNDIQSPQDLAGKKIATRVGSTGSWFISEYLGKNGIDPASVEIINLDTQVLPTALCSGDIDAFFIWQPFGARAQEICPDQMHILDTADGYINGYAVLGARPEWLATEAGKKAAVGFLRGMLEGRDVAAESFDKVAAYASEKFSLTPEAIKGQWETNGRHIGFDETFFKDHCALAEWMRNNSLLEGKLDFNEYIWTDGLKEIDPALVADVPPPC